MVKRFLFIMIALTIVLFARENPFFPSVGEKDILQSSNNDNSKQPLKRATITLPTYARTIKKVTIEYENLDASTETKTIELDNTVDWHLPIFISQSYTNTTTKQKSKKSKKVKKFKRIASIKYAKFYTAEKTLKIVTKDKIIRNFLLVGPHRIVLDFDRDTSLKSLVKYNKNNIFTKLKIGNHDGYYRAVVELDGYYIYKMKKISSGYLFELK
jgi:Na+-transporting NADH:ubiquinone oxidoreductase subunit NqrB